MNALFSKRKLHTLNEYNILQVMVSVPITDLMLFHHLRTTDLTLVAKTRNEKLIILIS